MLEEGTPIGIPLKWGESFRARGETQHHRKKRSGIDQPPPKLKINEEGSIVDKISDTGLVAKDSTFFFFFFGLEKKKKHS